jgi:hypothetical protein
MMTLIVKDKILFLALFFRHHAIEVSPIASFFDDKRSEFA